MSWLGVLKILPGFIMMCFEIYKFIKSAFETNPEKVIIEMSGIFKELNNAKTTEERVNAAKKMRDIISKP